MNESNAIALGFLSYSSFLCFTVSVAGGELAWVVRRTLFTLAFPALLLTASPSRADPPSTNADADDALAEIERSRSERRRPLAPTPDSLPYREPGVKLVSEPGDTVWNSPQLALLGGVLMVGGAASATIGGVMMATAETNDDYDVEESYYYGFFAILGGGVVFLAGAPMLIVGAWQVEPDRTTASPTAAELRVGPARAELAVTF